MVQQKNTQNFPQRPDTYTEWHRESAGWITFCHFYYHYYCGWHSCVHDVRVRPVLCFASMNGAACDSLLSVSACGCTLCGWTFFKFFLFPWALAFFPLRSVSCVGLLCVDSGKHTWCTDDEHRHRLTHTSPYFRKKKRELPYHLSLPLCLMYLYSSSVSTV